MDARLGSELPVDSCQNRLRWERVRLVGLACGLLDRTLWVGGANRSVVERKPEKSGGRMNKGVGVA